MFATLSWPQIITLGGPVCYRFQCAESTADFPELQCLLCIVGIQHARNGRARVPLVRGQLKSGSARLLLRSFFMQASCVWNQAETSCTCTCGAPLLPQASQSQSAISPRWLVSRERNIHTKRILGMCIEPTNTCCAIRSRIVRHHPLRIISEMVSIARRSPFHVYPRNVTFILFSCAFSNDRKLKRQREGISWSHPPRNRIFQKLAHRCVLNLQHISIIVPRALTAVQLRDETEP